MKCQIGSKKYHPTAMPTARPSNALSKRLRSSRMCSMSDIRASGFCRLAWPGMREPRARGGATGSGVVLISGGRSAGLVGALGLRERDPVDQGAVILRRCRRGQLLRRGRLALRGLALRGLALTGLGLAIIGLVAVAKSLRLRLEDTH